MSSNNGTDQSLPTHDSRESWIRLAVAMLLGTIGSVGLWCYVVVLPAVQADFGVDRATASMPYTWTMVGFAVGNVIFGRLADRFGIVRPIIGAACMLCAGFAIAGLAPDIRILMVSQGVLIGLGTAGTFGPLISELSYWFLRRRALAITAAASGNYLAGVVWPPLIQLGLTSEGWRATYVGIGIICLATMVPLALRLRGSRPETESSSVSPTGKRRQQLTVEITPRALTIILSIAGFACCMAMAMPQVHIVAYCVDLGYGVARGAEMLSLMLLGGVVSRLASGFIADYIGGVKVLLIGSVLQCLALLFYIPYDGLASLYIVSLFFGLAQGGIVPAYAIVVREFLPAKEAGERVGYVIMSTVMGMAVGGWMSGLIFDLTGSYEAAFVNGVLWNLLNMAIIGMLFWLSKPPKIPAAATA
ncbi:MAG: MFS transporter [Pseudomonadota bacterium]